MASVAGLLLFLVLIIVLCFLLAPYPATYKNNPAWYAVAISYVPSVLPWVCLMLFKAGKLGRRFYRSGFYVLGLVISTAFAFAVAVDLEMTFGLTPLLLLLLHTAKDSKNYKDVVSKLCYQMVVVLMYLQSHSLASRPVKYEYKGHNGACYGSWTLVLPALFLSFHILGKQENIDILLHVWFFIG